MFNSLLSRFVAMAIAFGPAALVSAAKCPGDFYLVKNQDDNAIIKLQDGAEICSGGRINIWFDPVADVVEKAYIETVLINGEDQEETYSIIEQRCEGVEPFSIFGDRNGDFYFQEHGVGDYLIDVSCDNVCDLTDTYTIFYFSIIDCP